MKTNTLSCLEIIDIVHLIKDGHGNEFLDCEQTGGPLTSRPGGCGHACPLTKWNLYSISFAKMDCIKLYKEIQKHANKINIINSILEEKD